MSVSPPHGPACLSSQEAALCFLQADVAFDAAANPELSASPQHRSARGAQRDYRVNIPSAARFETSLSLVTEYLIHFDRANCLFVLSHTVAITGTPIWQHCYYSNVPIMCQRRLGLFHANSSMERRLGLFHINSSMQRELSGRLIGLLMLKTGQIQMGLIQSISTHSKCSIWALQPCHCVEDSLSMTAWSCHAKAGRQWYRR